MNDIAKISVIIPCRNEEEFIGMCLDSIIANDYPQDQLEVLIMDGMSEDGTRAFVEDYALRHSFIRLLDNPKKITPAALNIGIANAKGEIIMRMDAHTTYENNYISKCVNALDKHGADNVGGVWRIIPKDNTLMGKAIVRSLSHRFGIGNTHYRLKHSGKSRWVDTVPFFCCKRDVFHKVGLFNQGLARGQDMEFSLRLKKAGCRTLLVFDIVSYYYARSDMKSFLKHNWSNGVWAVLPFAYSKVMPVSWRHLVPLAFVLGLVGSAALSLFRPEGVWLLTAIVGSYGASNLFASVHVAWRERDIRYLFVMPFVFASLHVAYGTGSLWGLVKATGHLLGSSWVRSRQGSGKC